MERLAYLLEGSLLVATKLPCLGRLVTTWGDRLLNAVLGPFEGI